MSLGYDHRQDVAMRNFQRYFNEQNENGNYGVFALHPHYTEYCGTELYIDTFITEYDGRDDVVIIYNGERYEPEIDSSKIGHYNRLLNLHLRKLIYKPVSKSYPLSHNSLGFNIPIGEGFTDLTTINKHYVSEYTLPETIPAHNRYHEYMDKVILKDGSEWNVLKWMNHPTYGRFYALIDLTTEKIKIVREDDIKTIPTTTLDVKYEYNAILPYTATSDLSYTLKYKTYCKYYSTNKIGSNDIRYYVATTGRERMTTITDLSVMDLPIVNGIVVDIKKFLDTGEMIIDLVPKIDRNMEIGTYYRDYRFRYLIYNRNKTKSKHNVLYISKKTDVKNQLTSYYNKRKLTIRNNIYKIKQRIEAVRKEAIVLEQTLSKITIDLSYKLIETEITNRYSRISVLQHDITILNNKISELNNVLTYLKNYKKRRNNATTNNYL